MEKKGSGERLHWGGGVFQMNTRRRPARELMDTAALDPHCRGASAGPHPLRTRHRRHRWRARASQLGLRSGCEPA